MKFVRGVLKAGGLFNTVLGLFFVNDQLLEWFLRGALWFEATVFRHQVVMPLPQNPTHLLLIHGFGAAALILGAALLYSARYPYRFLPFILIDGLGRLLYGSMMVHYVLKYSLMWSILALSGVELFFALTYILVSWRLAEP